jgi:hypothetical protein
MELVHLIDFCIFNLRTNQADQQIPTSNGGVTNITLTNADP